MRRLAILVMLAAAVMPFSSARAEEVTVRVMIPTALKLFRIGTDQFNEQNKGKYRAELDMIALESMFEKQMTHFMSRSDAYDVHGVHSSWMNTVARNLDPLNPYVSRLGPDLGMYGTGTMNSVSVKGNIIGPSCGAGHEHSLFQEGPLRGGGSEAATTPDEVLNAARAYPERPGRSGPALWVFLHGGRSVLERGDAGRSPVSAGRLLHDRRLSGREP
jgi:ABC-type glycerol-3-phosphate transport system substrate-binding protein